MSGNAIRFQSTKEEKCSSLAAKKVKSRTVVGRGVKSRLRDPGSELRLRTKKER